MTPVFQRAWGAGDPVIALHPLGLESSAFEGLARVLAERRLRTIAVDLPGFGKSSPLAGPPSASAMAEPVIALARSLERPPIVLGISMGGRVALEAAMRAPDAFAAVIPIAPYLPWLRYRAFLEAGAYIDPALAAWMPFERVWPALRWLAAGLQSTSFVRDDEIARAGMRFVYYLSCPATRAAFLAATREMALDPAWGPDGLWTRLPALALPGAFVWGERDRLVSLRFARPVARALPHVPQLILSCVGHWLNGPHHRCLANALAHVVGTFRDGATLAPTEMHDVGVPVVPFGCAVEDPWTAAASWRETYGR